MNANIRIPLRIGTISLDTPVLLAPLSGYSDLPFRLMLRGLGGLGLAYSEMLSPQSILLGGGKRRREMLATVPEDKPLGYQIYGTDPQMMADGARWLEDNGARLIDINMGCPERKISSSGAGAGLLRDPSGAVRVAERVVASVSVPVTAKMRLGWDEGNLVAAQLSKELEKVGVAAISVHGRTREQGYKGRVSREGIRRVVESVERVPVIGNGDINSVEDARMMILETGCAGIMLGRGATRDPWLAREVWQFLRGLPPLPRPSLAERWRLFRELFEQSAQHHGEKSAVVLFRKWIPPHAGKLRLGREEMIRLLRITNLAEMRQTLHDMERRSQTADPGIGHGDPGDPLR